jgi:hypothetical protein
MVMSDQAGQHLEARSVFAGNPLAVSDAVCNRLDFQLNTSQHSPHTQTAQQQTPATSLSAFSRKPHYFSLI